MLETRRFHAWRDSRRVAVLGMANSGKTVFLTSLIDRFLRADGARTGSRFGNLTWRVDRLDPVDGIDAFPYEYFREDCLRIQRWPDKTLASSQFRLQRAREGDGFQGALFGQFGEERTFIDIPGERVADFSIAGRSYAEWSDAMIAALGESRYISYSADYLRLLDSDDDQIDERRVLDAYKTVLAHFTRHLIPLVTPSTFLVDERGRYPGRLEPPSHEQSVEDLVAKRLSGIDEGSQFAPLSEGARSRMPDIAARFDERFQAYRDRLANPLGAGFSSCDQLIVLVDVAAILESGPQVYHATRKNLQLALEYLDPGTSSGNRLRDLTMRLLSGGRWRAGGLKQVAVIATKADCVHRLDRPNLVPLLKMLTGDVLRGAADKRGLAVEYLHCAAIEATVPEEHPWLSGYVSIGSSATSAHVRYRFKVSEVPAEWPAESAWKHAQFAYADPDPPPLDLLGREPFPGINMDKVAAFIGWPDERRQA